MGGLLLALKLPVVFELCAGSGSGSRMRYADCKCAHGSSLATAGGCAGGWLVGALAGAKSVVLCRTTGVSWMVGIGDAPLRAPLVC